MGLMPRRPDGLTARSEYVPARLRPSTAAALDRMRATTPRSRFIEKLIIEEEKRRREAQK